MSSYPDMYSPQGSQGSQSPQSAQQMIQRHVIVQKDEKGYGLTVTGDNPVFVQSVKDYGAAHRAGVHTGDRIIKVNGTLVTSSNHQEVVKMIKSGSFVKLTLLGEQGQGPKSPPPQSPSGPGIQRHADSRRTVTSPLPVNSQQDAQVKVERLNTFKRMLDQERTLLDGTEREYALNPTEKLQKDINGINTRIAVLEKQLQKAASNMQTAKPGGSSQSAINSGLAETIVEGQVSLGNAALPSDQANKNEDYRPNKEELPQGISHTRQRSSPDTFNRVTNESPESQRAISAGLKRNNSDAQAKEVARHKFQEGATSGVDLSAIGKKQRRDMESVGRALSLPSESGDPDYEEIPDLSLVTPKVLTGMQLVTPMEGVEETSLLSADQARIDQSTIPQLQMATINMEEVYNPPAVTEVPVVQAAGLPLVPTGPGKSPGQGQAQMDILCQDEDEFLGSDNEGIEDHGPFNELDQLEKKHAHMAVFLHYLISNSDPSSTFFYLVTDSYASGNLKEMKKWVYDIFGTFLGVTGPLRIQMDETIVSSIENTIKKQNTNEEAMRSIFLKPRAAAKLEVEELLADFRSKRALGLGSIYGDQHVGDDMDKVQEAKVVESILLPHLERLTKDEAEKDAKNQALAAGLITFMKQAGVRYTSALERAPSFMNRDKQRLPKFARTTKKHNTKGHSFQEHQYLKATLCDKCQGYLWGIGCQGLQCTYCDFNIHRTGVCLEQLTTECVGKGHKRKGKNRFSSNLAIDTKQAAPPPVVSPQPQIINLKSENDELAQMKPESHNAQVSKNVDVSGMVGQFEKVDNATAGSRGSVADSGVSNLSYQDSNHGSSGQLEDQSAGDQLQQQPKKKAFIKRSASLKTKGEEKKEGRRNNENKRSRSDVDMDGQNVAAALSPSQASSSSSLSTKSQDSPRASLEQLSKAAEEEDSDFEAEMNTPNWQKAIDKDIVKKLKPKEVKRQEVINELFHTERTHVRQLKVIKKVFFQPMLDQEIIPQTTIYYIFPNIDEMIEIHGSLNDVMKKDRRTSHIIQEVGTILLERFDGEAGDSMKKAGAAFCQNQNVGLEHIKKLVRKEKEKEKDKKEGSVSRFMEEAEGNPLCRRLPLAGIMATGYQRLTKYPLLIENLLKYTTAKSKEHDKLVRCLEKSKEILSYVNQAVKESENRFRLLDYNMKMDKTPLEKSNNALVANYKNFDLEKYKLIHDGTLTWKVNRNKSIEVQVLLLEELVVLLTKADEKLILKLHSTTNQANPTHSPIIKLSTVLCRPVATNKKAFFLVSMNSAAGPQIYELVTQSTPERTAWMDVILATQEAERKQCKTGRRNARTTTNQRPVLPPDLHPVYEEPKGPEINNPPEVANSDVIIAPEPEVVTQNSLADPKTLEPDPSGDIRETLEKTVQQVQQVPPEDAKVTDRLQQVMLLANRMKPVLDETVGESAENTVLAKAFETLLSQLTLVVEQSQSSEVEMVKMKQENVSLETDRDLMQEDKERLTTELTMTRHELNSLQTERLQNNPNGSVDSIPNILDDDRLTVEEKQQNRQSYSGESSVSESEDSKTVESSEPEEPTVVHDDEGTRSLNEHDSDVPITPNAMSVLPEVFQADMNVVNQVVNEQLLDLQSRTMENEIERTAEATQESSNTLISEVNGDDVGSENVLNGGDRTSLDDLREGDESVGNHSNTSVGEDVEDVARLEKQEENAPGDNLEEGALLDVNRNSDPANIIDPAIIIDPIISDIVNSSLDIGSSDPVTNIDAPVCDVSIVTDDNYEQVASNGDDASSNEVPIYDPSSTGEVLIGDVTVEEGDKSSPSNTEDNLREDDIAEEEEEEEEEGDAVQPCVIEVVEQDNERNSANLISNADDERKTPEDLQLGQVLENPERQDSIDVVPKTEPLSPSINDSAPTVEPFEEPLTPGLEPTIPDLPRTTETTGSRPLSIISQDSASSDLGSSSVEETDGKKSPGIKSQDPPIKTTIIEETETHMV